MQPVLPILPGFSPLQESSENEAPPGAIMLNTTLGRKSGTQSGEQNQSYLGPKSTQITEQRRERKSLS